MKQFEIRADYNGETIVVYQAYRPAIADAAVAARRFVNPFLLNRMTGIAPSTRWMMHRSDWASKPGQDRVVAVRIPAPVGRRRCRLSPASSRGTPTTGSSRFRDLPPLAHEMSAHLSNGDIERAETLPAAPDFAQISAHRQRGS
jgi:hypothetical protein